MSRPPRAAPRGGWASAQSEWANRHLAPYQRVATVEFRESLPRNQLGKLLKRELREPYWTVPS